MAQGQVRSMGRVAPGIAPWSSHRSGRARQMHPVRHVVEHRCPSHNQVVSRWHAAKAQCPRRGSNSPSTTRRPLRSTGSGRPFPRFTATMERCDFLTAFSPRFVSFAWRYHEASAFRPRSAADAWPADHPGVCCTGCSRSGFSSGNCQDLPRSRKTRLIIRHVPPTPV